MNADPRKEPGFKARRIEDRVTLLLGAILDELIAQRAPPVVNAQASKPRRKGDVSG